MSVGVIGTGAMGAFHVRTLTESVDRAQVSAVADLDPSLAAAVAESSGARVLEDPLAVVADADVDAVLIASADATHEPLVLACLAEGKPVLCEKPLAPTAEAAQRIVAAEVEKGRRLVTVGFMRRYDPGYVALAEAYAAGEIGAALMLHCVHRNARSRPDNPSAQLIRGSAVHEFDIARWLLGEEIVRISVHHGRPSSHVVGDTRDPMLLVAETEGGVLVDVEAFMNCRYGYEARCELVGESGTLGVDEPSGLAGRGPAGLYRKVAAGWAERFGEAYRRELCDWVDGVAAGEHRGATAWDGYAATAVAAAGVSALGSGEPATPVPVRRVSRPALYS